MVLNVTLEAQLPIYWVPVLRSVYKLILSITQEPTICFQGYIEVIWRPCILYACAECEN